MSMPYKSTGTALVRFESGLKAQRLSPRTFNFYRETVHAVLQIMEAEKLPTNPSYIKAEHIRQLLDSFDRRKLAIATRKGYLSALKKYLLLCNCNAFAGLVIPLPQDIRPSVDWYTSFEAKQLLECDKSALQTIVIHCELCLGMRRVEIIRLRPEDVHDLKRYIDVRGKSSKMRSIPYAPGTAEVMKLAMQRRAEQIDAHKSGEIPDRLILWLKAGKLHAYSEEGYGLDKVVTEPLTKKLGFRVTNHKGRRTFGRSLYRAGVPVPTISKILGHESTEVTLKYIGVDLDDMRKAMEIELYA